MRSPDFRCSVGVNDDCHYMAAARGFNLKLTTYYYLHACRQAGRQPLKYRCLRRMHMRQRLRC